jgi:hypothetical protein
MGIDGLESAAFSVVARGLQARQWKYKECPPEFLSVELRLFSDEQFQCAFDHEG